MQLSRAHINKDQTLTFGYTRTSKGIVWTVESETGSATIHEDLKAAFQKLISHVIDVCKMSAKQPEEFTITCINWKSNNTKSGVVISGSRKCNGRCFNFNTPYIKLDDENNPDDEQLQEILSICQEEIAAYIEGKKFTAKQAEMEFKEKEEEVEVK